MDLDIKIAREELTAHVAATLAQHLEQVKVFVTDFPPSTPCDRHPDSLRIRDDERSWWARRAIFAPCAKCQVERAEKAEQDRLHRMGVPLNLCRATLANWIPPDDQSKANLDVVVEFARAQKGFLILLGDLGTGKSHLAAAVLRQFRGGLFAKQSLLLRELRQSYRDKAVIDPVDKAQSASCLVLDDVGMSAGGRDELPMVRDIVDFRHGEQLPTVLTSNLDFDELGGVLGPRMHDRLRECAFAILTFGGPSHRKLAREAYFKQKP